MKVIDLIIALQDLPPNMNVMMDVTPTGSNMFHFKEVACIEPTETDIGHSFIGIYPVESEISNLNDN